MGRLSEITARPLEPESIAANTGSSKADGLYTSAVVAIAIEPLETVEALERIERMLREVQALAPGYAPVYVQLGRIARYRGQLTGGRHSAVSLASSEKLVARALELDPDLVAAHVQRGYLALKRGDLGGASKATDKAAELGAPAPRIDLMRAEIAWRGGQLKKAVELAQRAVENARSTT
jgi:tetratricopeptide (TPR) repeat protein